MKLIDGEHLRGWILARWSELDPTSEYPLKAIDILDQIDREEAYPTEAMSSIYGYNVDYLIAFAEACRRAGVENEDLKDFVGNCMFAYDMAWEDIRKGIETAMEDMARTDREPGEEFKIKVRV